MIDQELLRDATESYLKSIISDVSGSLDSDFDSLAPFGELGIDSFYVLKIIRRLEADFGALSKSLLFENFNINDLAKYFVAEHGQTLAARFEKELKSASACARNDERRRESSTIPVEAEPPAPSRTLAVAEETEPIRILERDLSTRPDLQALVQTLFDRYKSEGCVSRGTRKIAPNLFIGSARRGYFNYGRSKNLILVYGYAGPEDYLPTLLQEMYRYCEERQLQLNVLGGEDTPLIGGIAFSATPFGAMQRIANLKTFSLEGGAMRRLRYQVSKFEKAGACRTAEYRCGSDEETDRRIAGIIDQWCETRTMVNPLVHDVRNEILAGTLAREHRIFLTYLDEALQNVIVITAMSADANGYLMDMEFYPSDMPMGGLEFAIVQIIKTLVAEGCDTLSMGGTYGCKLDSSVNADPELDRLLDDLRAQNIFNDQGNLQFKNKFRPENSPIYLCRPVGSGNPDSVLDIIMMIADPERMQTPDEDGHRVGWTPGSSQTSADQHAASLPRSSEPFQASSGPLVTAGNDRSRILTDYGFNPLNIPNESVELDLKTDSWAQLDMPSIGTRMRHLHAQLQQPVGVEDSLRAVFPFAHFILAASGQAAENIFFKAWPKKGIVLQNLLFPSTIFHEIDKGFDPSELPRPEVFQMSSTERYKGNLALDALQAQVEQNSRAIACVCIEVANNAAGGAPVSIQHLHDVRALLAAHSIPLVIDCTRVVENAQLLIELEKEHAEKTIWSVVRETLSIADAVIGSLTKDFCVNRGGIIATNDTRLFRSLQEVVSEEGSGIDLIDRKLIALSLQNRKHIEAKVLHRMEAVRRIWLALSEHNVPIVHPAGGHCILIDVKRLPEFRDLKEPVPSFLAWMYLNSGIRAAAHSVGMLKHTTINDLVRLAIPVGLSRDQVDEIVKRLGQLFRGMANIPEVVMESGRLERRGAVYANYRLIGMHNASVEAPAASPTEALAEEAATSVPRSNAATSSPAPADGLAWGQTVSPREGTAEGGPAPASAQKAGRGLRDIAIVGMAGRYPKARNPRELWINLAAGRDCVEEISPDRYERRLQHGPAQKYRGGFIDDVDKFDSLFFNISPREAEMLDPQERLFLEVTWEAIEDAGYYPEILAKEDAARNIGVYVGAVWAMYQIVGVDAKHAGHKAAPNSFLWSIANRVSYWMNLSGPSLTVDTACSSSLTAIYLACEAILSGECSAAVAGGVNLDLHQAKLEINQVGGALSADGVCRSFGKGANGYVAGEGVGALLLKRLDQAVRDGDHIYGVIKSAVVNHGGRTSGYFVPNPSAQRNVIQSALEKANVGARSIGYIEAHGTGTQLGDPIEITGASQAFKSDDVENQTCAIGSIKSNIGHLEAAAGVASVSKVLLQMKHRQLAPSLHSSELNEFIDFEHSPFYVPQRLEEWKAKEADGVPLPLRAGVSSFGAGGANAHVILESYEPAAPVKAESGPPAEWIFPLSARTEDQLRETAVRLANFLEQHPVDLNDAANTLQHGRRSFEHRLAIVAKTREELIEKLTGFIDGRTGEGIAVGQVKLAENVLRLLSRREKQEFIRLLSQSRDSHKIAALWAEGLLADWQGSQISGSGNRISLPTYPFAGKQYWVGAPSQVRHAFQPVAGVHPMLDSNESTFERQLFKKTFHDLDFFIYDHRVADIPTLPGVAYLELARKAGEIAAGRPVRRIQNVLWVSPISVQSSVPQEVFIELKPAGEAVQFEVFSEAADGNKVLHSQGKLLYTTTPESAAEPKYVDLNAIRTRCTKAIDAKSAYPLFKSVGLDLGPSFQVLQEVYKSDAEVLGVLKLPELREGDLQSMLLHPSLVDGSLQAGMAARLGENVGEMLVPYSIGEIEILHPLQSNCLSYTTEAKGGKKGSRVLKSDVLILDQEGKILAKIRESTGVPLVDVHKKSENEADVDGFSKLYYAYEWEKAPLGVEAADRNASRSMLLFDTQETLRSLYETRLKEEGAAATQVILVRPGEMFRELDASSYEIDPKSKDDFTRLFESLAEKSRSIEEICFAWPVGGADSHADFHDEHVLRESLQNDVTSFLFLCQSLIQARLEGKVQLLYLYSPRPGEAQPQHDAMSGFVKTLRGEYPKLLCKTLEVRQEEVNHGQLLDAIWAELGARVQDVPVVRYEAQERYVRRLQAFDLEKEAGEDAPSEGTRLRDGGVYLITGGAGGLGLIFAEFLAKQYKARLILSGRRGLPAEWDARLEKLRGWGAEVLYVRADVSNREDVAHLVGESRARFGEINGVIHSAGLVRDSYIRNKTQDEMSAVLAPKVYGTLQLDEATTNEPLDFFVMFSSLAAVTGNVGQCDYSFANHFMDSFASERERLRARGERSGKTLSVNWSLWADGGMRPDEQTELLLRKTMGMKPLSAATGLEAFVLGLASGRSQFAVVEGVQERLELAWGGRKKSPAIVEATPPASPDHPEAAQAASEGDEDLRVRLQNDLSQIVIDFLKLDAADMSSEKILLDLGFDSLGLTTFANAVNDKFQLDITPILFFDYPSIGEIAKHLAVDRKAELLRFYRGAANAAPSAPTPAQAQQDANAAGADRHQATSLAIRKGWNPTTLDRKLDREAESPPSAVISPELRFVNDPIAIVGMSGVMPQSDDLDEFWENLKSSKDLITVIPPDRWRWEDYYGDPLKEANKSNSKWGGFMREVDKFDPLFFGISPREAEMMDPQQRIFLEHVWKAVEDSGQRVSDLSGTRTGLFLGVGTTDYAGLLSSHHVALDGYTASGNAHSVTANRVSFLLNLRGPSAPIDTACSSSLVAFHRAVESIHTGSCDMAVVGGVQVMLSPAAYISFGMAGMLSGDGKCKTFDKSANGYVRGEGCGAVFLKRLSAAEAEGNHIYAVIKATAENHGGRVTTMTAPNSAAQTELLIDAYTKAHIDPATVGYIECHGTGTGLGDPIEIQSLSKAFSELYKRYDRPPAEEPHCGLSSVKTNIGHLETGAGIAGVLKALLAIKHRQIPANLHLQEINPYINLKGTPFYIADKLTQWEAPVGEDGARLPRRAGVSSFGFGGANAHVVLEEYVPPRRESPAAPAGPCLIVLSAKNENRLKEYARSLYAYLGKHEVDLADLAYTLQVGRDEMPSRLALVVSSTKDLGQKLAGILGGESPEDTYRNTIKSGPAKSLPAGDAKETALIRDLVEEGALSKLAGLWVSGAAIEWRSLYKSSPPRRISAPTYPFARERYWIPETAVSAVEDQQQQGLVTEARLHPLIHRNVSTLKEQKFASRFEGTEFYLADHKVGPDAVLPAVAYVEMAAAAGELSAERKVRFIRDMTWLTPITVGNDAKDVEVLLSPGRNEVEFSVRTVEDGHFKTHCRGKLAYMGSLSEPATLDVAEIRARCSAETIAGADLYPFLDTSGLHLGNAFQSVRTVYAGNAEFLAVLQLPDHLRSGADRFWLHPSLLDGALHSAIGLVKKANILIPWSVPFAVGELQVFRSLKDVRYAHGTWDQDAIQDEKSPIKVQLELCDGNGGVLVRVRDFVARPLAQPVTSAPVGENEEQRDSPGAGGTHLQTLIPVWSPVRLETDERDSLRDSRIAVLGGDASQLEWIRASCSNVQHLQLVPGASVEEIARVLGYGSFDQLLWVAPDVGTHTDSTGGDELIAQQEIGVLAFFRIIKALLDLGYATRKLQWTILSCGTQYVTEGDPVQPVHAGVIGLVGSLAKEYPHWDLRLLDLDSLESVSAAECLSLPCEKLGNALAHRGGEWRQQGLEFAGTLTASPPLYRQNGVYVVIGGAGGVGEVWSRFMIERYQANVVWIGRRERDATIDKQVEACSRLGPAPLYIAADATSVTALEQARTRILETHPAIHGVVHSAIVLRDQSMLRMTEPDFRASLSAKIDISVNMDRVFGRDELDFMLFFSSIISFFKSPGQSNYAAGCTFKDAFALSLRQQRAYPVKIMNWGYWGSVGVVADESHNKIMARLGMGSIEAAEGMTSLERFLSSDLPQMALIKTSGGEALTGPSLSEIITSHLAKQSPRQPHAEPNRSGVKTSEMPVAQSDREETRSSPSAGLNMQMKIDHIQRVVIDKVSDALRLDAAMIRGDAPLADYGVDSIIGVNLVRTLNEALKIDLEPMRLFDYSTVEQLAQYISTLLPEESAAQPARTAGVAQTSGDSTRAMPATTEEIDGHRFLRGDLFAEESGAGSVNEDGDPRGIGSGPIAIIGMSGRFAESESLDAFWQNLVQGKDLVKEVSRWSASDCAGPNLGGTRYCSRASCIDSVDQFDPAFFGISTQEATYMDPQQRLFLEESWKALEDAGYAGASVQEKQCGVYVGCGTSNYADLFGKEPPPQAWWGNSQSVVPARIAYYLNLHGPAMAVDTACSSTLVAIHLACQGLWSRETEMALAGGVYVQATAGFHQVANRAGMLSPNGNCYSFDARADGFVPGEAVGVVVLKRLSDALRDGDHVHAVIAGSGINQDGRSNGLIAPNGRAQERLERSVYDRFEINPETIQVVEAHGTGTLLGDSIEHEAISRAFREYTDRKQFCAIGSVKTNIGHAGNAAGIASVLKLLLAIKHGQIPPSLHFQSANPAIDFESSPFYVNTVMKEWPAEDGQKRRGAVSSFGFNGTNAHLVIEEPAPAERGVDQAPGYVVVLSARSSAQLKQEALDLLSLARRTPGLSMNDLSFSLFVGRAHLSHRLSCVTRDQEEMIHLLEQWIETGAANQIYTSELQGGGKIRQRISLTKFGNYCIQECRQAVDAAGYLENLAAIADLYVQGYSLDFQALFLRQSRRMPLPTYPFARERYWVDAAATVTAKATAVATTRLHPLLHTNTSTLSQSSYGSVFTGTESFLMDQEGATNGHEGEKVLPEAAYLEMARAAVELAVPCPEGSRVIDLEDTVWEQAMVLTGGGEVGVALFASNGDGIDYEIHSGEGERRIAHCQGRAVVRDRSAADPLNIDALVAQMQGGEEDADGVYAELAAMGARYGIAHRAITHIHMGDGQLLARLSVPPALATSEASVRNGNYVLHPSLVTGALQAALRLAAGTKPGSGPLLARGLERLRVLSPCTGEMFAWARLSEGDRHELRPNHVDIDLIDPDGHISVQMHGLSFQESEPSAEPVIEAMWLFSKAQSLRSGNAESSGPMGAAEKMELFLRQETALQLQKSIDAIPADQSYFDLGLTSLALANLIRNMNQLLEEELQPSALFEYTDIQSLAAHLAQTYTAKIDALWVERCRAQAHSGEQSQPAKLTPFSPTPSLTARPPELPQEPPKATPSEADAKDEALLEQIMWQEGTPDEGYEKVTF